MNPITTIPIDRATKKPAVTWAHLRRGESINVLPHQDTGLLTGERSGFVVVDYDPRHDLDGSSWRLLVELGSLGTYAIRTRSGGLHLYYLHPGYRCKNSVDRIARGVDVRGDGGYVKIPPSEGYSVISNAPVLPAPAWLLAVCRVEEKPLSSTPVSTTPERTRRALDLLQSSTQQLKAATSGGNDLLARLSIALGGYAGALPDGLVVSELEKAISNWDDRERHLDTMRRALEAGADDPWPDEPEPELLARFLTGAADQTIATGSVDLPAIDPNVFSFLTNGSLSRVLPPIAWICEALRFTNGAPFVFAGYGYSGKTAAAQSLAVAIASGAKVWGQHVVESPGRVVHLDYEQGERLTVGRYQRLAKGLGVDLSKIPLAVAILPRIRISEPRAIDALYRQCDGAALVILDSLRASSDLDENSSDSRRVHDALTHVSERTGAAFLILDHARKSPTDGSPVDAKQSMRGSSAKFDACAGLFYFTGKKGEAPRVSHEKERISGRALDTFGLRISDTDEGGLLVEQIGDAELRGASALEHAAREMQIEALILTYVGSHPRCGLNEIRAGVRSQITVRNEVVDVVTERIIREMKVSISSNGTGKKREHFINQ